MKKNFISVILPTYNRYHVCLENVENILKTQIFKEYEIVICDDSDKDYYLKESEAFQTSLKQYSQVKYLYCARFDVNGNKDYGLARARNFGIVNAEGEFLIFLDDRITPVSETMFMLFFNALRNMPEERVWYFGNKGANKSDFVENCSAIKKSHIVDYGMFCERIDKYGGMTKELSARFKRHGFVLKYLPDALAKQVCKSGGWDQKHIQIPQMKEMVRKLIER